MKSPFAKGLLDGIPIALGYLSVSFGFGILAVRSGLTTLVSVLISASNLTSAGQAAGIGIIAAGGSYIEMALTQLVINLRYGLMSISLSQKLDDTFNTPRRLIAAYGITDEIFAVASAQKGLLTARYMYGLISVSTFGWCLGTFLGASAGALLPPSLTNAMGIVLYAMFIAIVIPPARKSRGVLAVAATAAVCSMVFKYLLPQVTGGFAIIFSAIIAAVAGAFIFPVSDKEGEAA
jgi:Predicted branched-chain amino acid permease (azaleucine resistance)